MRKLLTLITALAMSVGVGAQTIWDVVVSSTNHNTLEAAVTAAGLETALAANGSMTLFAPTDAAFAALPAGTVDALLADPNGALTDVLLYHVVGAEAFSTSLSNGQEIITLNGASVTVTINMDGVFINNALVTVADIDASNGVVHVIDAVLVPEEETNTIADIVINSPVHNTLEAALVAAGLVETLSTGGPYTVFAPTDDAFAALPAGVLDGLLADPNGLLTEILFYHVVGASALSTDLSDGQEIVTLNGNSVLVTINGGNVFINDAQVIVADLIADNGVVHVIDAVLVPEEEVVPTIYDIVANSEVHNTLQAAIEAAGLDVDLSGAGSLTLFAPTDAAFAALPVGVVDALLADPNGALTNVLLYHVLGSTVLSTDLSDGQMATTLNGLDITVTITGGNVFINDAQVIIADIIASNGVVHVIDAVLVPTEETNTVVDIIVNSPDHNTLEAAVVAAGLVETLSGSGPYTVFAPTDAAFAALPAGVLDALLADPNGALTEILFYHVVGGTALSTDLSDGQEVVTLNGASVIVTISGGNVFINDAQVIIADIIADNGVVHVIDAVLVPESEVVPTIYDIVSNSEVHNTLQTALELSGLDVDMASPGSYTLFAPTDAAFAALPAGVVDALIADPNGALTNVLLYHVLGSTVLSTDLSDGQIATTLNGLDITVTITGGNVFINDAQVIIADIIASNGVVHVIDAVLVPTEETNTVVDIIVNSPDHNTLEAAVVAAGLVETLSGSGPYTVFAPTDAAFAALPAGVLDALLADPNGALTEILFYHVVGGTALSTDLSDGQEVVTLNGASVIVTISGGNVFINDAQVIIADIIADNGVVHVIDAVLVPESEVVPTIYDIVSNSEVHNTLQTALELSGLDVDMSGPGNYTLFAPTDDAFAALPAGVLDAALADPNGLLTDILLYHVLGATVLSTDLSDGQVATTLNGQDIVVTITGGNVFINDAQVIIADIIASNGVVHVIDAVLVPASEPEVTVWDIIVNSPDHTVLETAVLAAGLNDELANADASLTVFAPTDEAFAALPAGTIASLLANPAALTQILLYHVVGSEAFSTDLSDGQSIATLQGQSVTINITGGNVFVNDAQVIVADLDASNGVVHVIDAVLSLPVSVNETTNNTFSVFPNPFNEQITLTSSDNENALYHIVDVTGREVASGMINSGRQTLDMSALSAGQYVIQVVSGNTVFSHNIIKQ